MTTQEKPFSACDLSTPRGLPPRPIGEFATLEEAFAAAEAMGVPANIHEGYHWRAYVGPYEGRTIHPSQGYKFAGCPCKECRA